MNEEDLMDKIHICTYRSLSMEYCICTVRYDPWLVIAV